MSSKEEDLIRRIASVIGHEFRNPLAVLNNSLYFVKSKIDNESLDPKVKKHLGFLSSEILTLDRMISRTLAFSRVLEPKFKTASLQSVVENALSDWTLPSKLKIRQKPAKLVAEACVDASLLSVALKNIIQNAIDAMGGEGEIFLTGAEKSGEVSLEISDSGPGLKAEDLTRLFEPFATSKSRGLGLGLAEAKKIVLAHQGRIEGSNKPAGGASFKIFLPK